MSAPRLVLVTAAWPIGAGEDFLEPEVDELVRQGCRVIVVPRDDDPKLESRLPPVLAAAVPLWRTPLFGRPALGALLRLMLRSPWRVIGSVLPLLAKAPRRALHNLAVVPKAAWLAERLRQAPADHVHAHWATTPATLALLAARWSDLPFSMTCHQWDIFDDNLLATKVRSARFARFISERGRLKALALGAQAGRCTVIPMAPGYVAAGPAAPPTDADRFMLATPASFLEVKGHRYLLDAIATLARHGQTVPVHVTCFGAGPLEAALRQQADRLGIGARVRFAGQWPHAALLEELRSGRYHAVCLPSIVADDGEYEGIPVSLMEAMAAGLPVISTHTGSIPELVPESVGLLVPDRDPDALATAIARLASDPAAYRQAARDCHAVIARGWTARQSVHRLLGAIDAASPSPAGIADRALPLSP